MFRPLKVLDVELSGGVRDIGGLERYGAVKALIRLHGVPIGHASVPVQGGHCSAQALSRAIVDQHTATVARYLSRDQLMALPSAPVWIDDPGRRPSATDAGTCPLVTVAVCTRDRPATLAMCLQSLSALCYPRLDLLVVDNASESDATERVVRSYPLIRYVREPRPGLDWARNRAMTEARGNIIAYTDDDVIVDPQWVDGLARVFTEHDDVMAVTGLVVPHELETEAQVLFEERAGFGRGFERRRFRCEPGDGLGRAFHIPAWTFGTGANMAFRTGLFERIGGFDPALDVGTVSHGGGDLEMFFRVLEEGHVLAYEPAALVWHRHRREYSALRSQMRSYGCGRSAFLVRSAMAYPHRRLAIIHCWVRSMRRRLLPLLRSLAVPRDVSRDLLLADVGGALVGLVRYWRARRIAAEIERTFGPIAGRVKKERPAPTDGDAITRIPA